MRNLKFAIFATIAAFVFAACEKDKNNEQDEPKSETSCKIVIDAHIVTGKYYPRYNCNLYDINLISNNGEVYSLGTVKSGTAKEFTLPSSHKNTDIMFMAFKLGKDESEANDSYYLCPCMSDGTPYPVLAVDYKTAVFSVNDDMVFRTYKYKTKDELAKFAKSIMEELSNGK